MEECALQVNIHNIFQLKPRTKKKEMKNGFSWLYSKIRSQVQLLLTSGKIQKKK